MGSQLSNRFSRGADAEPGQFPFHAIMFQNFQYKCGASLLTDRVVISAAHCVVDDATQNVLPVDVFRLMFGVTDLDNLSGNEALRKVAQVIKHPEYVYDKIVKQDLALMFIESPLQLSRYINPVCLFDTQEPMTNAANELATVLGFGSSTLSREPSKTLTFGSMSIITRSQCIDSSLTFAVLPEQSTFCAKAFQGQLTCPGL